MPPTAELSGKRLGERYAPFAGITISQQGPASPGDQRGACQRREHALWWPAPGIGARSTATRAPGSATTSRASPTAICPAQTAGDTRALDDSAKVWLRGARAARSSAHDFAAVGQRTGHGDRRTGRHDPSGMANTVCRQRGVTPAVQRQRALRQHPRQRAAPPATARAGERIGNHRHVGRPPSIAAIEARSSVSRFF